MKKFRNFILVTFSLLIVALQLVSTVNAALNDGVCDNNEIVSLNQATVNADAVYSNTLGTEIYPYNDSLYVSGEIVIYYNSLSYGDCKNFPTELEISLYNIDTEDSYLIQTVNSNDIGAITFDSTSYPEGWYEFRILRTSNSYVVASDFFIDNSAPEFNTTYVDYSGYLNGITYVAFEFSDNSGLLNIEQNVYPFSVVGFPPDEQILNGPGGIVADSNFSVDLDVGDGPMDYVTGVKIIYDQSGAIKDLAGNEISAGPYYISETLQPNFVRATNLDTNENGLIDGVEVEMTEDVFLTGNGYASFYPDNTGILEDYTDNVSVDGKIMTFTFDSESTYVGEVLYVIVTDNYYSDNSGNTGNFGGDLYSETFDFFGIVSAETHDVNQNGQIDHLKLNFSQGIDDTSFNSANIQLSDGYLVDEWRVDDDCTGEDMRPENADYVCITLIENGDYDTDVILDYSYDARDQELFNTANSVVNASLITGSTTDMARPIFVEISDIFYEDNQYARNFTLLFSEPVNVSDTYLRVGLNRNALVYSGSGTDSVVFRVSGHYFDLYATNNIGLSFLDNSKVTDLNGNLSWNPSGGFPSTTKKITAIYGYNYRDSDGNGRVDTVTVAFNDSIDFSSYVFDSGAYSFADYAVVGIWDYYFEGDIFVVDFELEEKAYFETYVEESRFEFIADSNNILSNENSALGTLKSFDLYVSDSAAPYLIDAYTSDEDNNGNIDRIYFEYTELVDDYAQYDPASPGITINGIDVLYAEQTTPGLMYYDLDESDLPTSGTDFIPAFTYGYVGGNEDGLDFSNYDSFNIRDGARPVMYYVEANNPDELVVGFSEVLDESTLSSLNFRLFNTNTESFLYANNVILNADLLTIYFEQGTFNYNNLSDYLFGFTNPEGNEMTDLYGNILLGAGGGAAITNNLSFDNTPPVISEVQAISTPTNNNQPVYIFESDEDGTLEVGGSCSTETVDVLVGENEIVFMELADNEYTDCTVKVFDASGNESNALQVPNFRIDTQAPVLQEIQPIDTPLTENLVVYYFETSENGDFELSGCSAEVDLDLGTVTFVNLVQNIEYSCTLVVTDLAGNVSNQLNIGPFVFEGEGEGEGEGENLPKRSGGGGSRKAPSPAETNTNKLIPYAEAVKIVLENNIITKEPLENINKCEALVVLSRFFEWQIEENALDDGFSDTPIWCKPYAKYARNNSVVFGLNSFTLGTESLLKRYEAAVLIYRELVRNGYVFNGKIEVEFADQLVDWARESVETLTKEGAITGFESGEFLGGKSILKQDFAVILLRLGNEK